MRRAIAIVVLSACCAPGWAAGIETLLMPGQTTEAHSKYESDCGQCHDRTDRSKQTQLCLACHDDVSSDLKAKRGLHGRMPNAERSQCNACHSEHRGRDADIVKFDIAAFDHGLTDFPLEGMHAGASCGTCHESGKLYRDAPARCVDCHKARDPHEGRLGRQCASCHNPSTWADIRFDHSKTQFPLVGAHLDATCTACHAGNRFEKTPAQCSACHAIDDVHRGSRGSKCDSCHTSKSWTTARFDHARETGFALLGTHSKIECSACHASGDFKRAIPDTCQGCHRADDVHATRFGERCETCHTNEKWNPSTFDHLKDAQLALTGKHADLPCHRCHTADVHAQKLDFECASCHKLDDVHFATTGAGCRECHGGDAWKPALGFDHGLSDFPLLGLHTVVPCARCHENLKFGGTQADCNACHAQDDIHEGGLGAECASCHTANGWQLWEFDHTKTRFALTGAHSKLACASCHRDTAGRMKVSTDCASCHRSDDVHLGRFGSQCQQCHSTKTFRGARRR